MACKLEGPSCARPWRAALEGQQEEQGNENQVETAAHRRVGK